MIEVIAQLQQYEVGVDGPANHVDVFQPVYQMLLALNTAGASRHIRAKLPSMVDSLQTVVAGLSHMAVQPVIAAMLARTFVVWSASEADDSFEVSGPLEYCVMWNELSCQMQDRCCGFALWCMHAYISSYVLLCTAMVCHQLVEASGCMRNLQSTLPQLESGNRS